MDWLKELQRTCGNQVPLVKHDSFVRLCHTVTGSGEPPEHVLALSSSPSDSPQDHSDDPNTTPEQADPEQTRDPAAQTTAPSSTAPRWAQRTLQATAVLIECHPRLSLSLVTAALLPLMTWGAWQIFADLNRTVSSLGAALLTLAITRPLVMNVVWSAKILLGLPIRAGVWLAEAFETDQAPQITD